MRVISFTEVEDKNYVYLFAFMLGIVLGSIAGSWIISNAGLGPGHGTNELARFIAKLCVYSSTIVFLCCLFTKMVSLVRTS